MRRIISTGLFLLVFSPLQTLLADSFTLTTGGGMNVARFNPAATRLANGQVLVSGGQTDFFTTTTSTELYDPASQSWTALGDLPAGDVVYQTSTLLSDGRVLVTGGVSLSLSQVDFHSHVSYLETETVTNACEIYDPSTGWQSVAQMNTPRYQHAATLLPDGTVLVTGGIVDASEDATNSAEIYDPAADTWTLIPPMNQPLNGHSSFILPNTGNLIVAGGNFSTDTEIYSFSTETWTESGDLETERTNHTTLQLEDGDILVAGGMDTNYAVLDTVELYNHYLGTWAYVGNLTTNRCGHSASSLPDGKVLVSGGFTDYPVTVGVGILESAEIYDPDTQAWNPTANCSSLLYPEGFSTQTLLQNGTTLTTGGVANVVQSENGAPPEAGVDNYSELFTLADSFTLTTGGGLNVARYSPAATLLANGKVLVSGGQTAYFTTTASTELYDPASQSWTALGDLPAGDVVYQTSTLLSDGRVLVTGGVSLSIPTFNWVGHDPSVVYVETEVVTNACEIYDPATGWHSVTPMTTPRYGHAASLLPDGRVLVTGGVIDAYNDATNSTEIYDPAADTWTQFIPMNQPLYGHSSFLLPNGNLIVAGGILSTDTETYDFSTAAWIEDDQMDTGRTNHTTTQLSNGDILVAGGASPVYYEGYGYFVTVQNTAELYDYVSDTWSYVGDMTTNRCGHGASLLPDGKVLVSGGFTYDFPEFNQAVIPPFLVLVWGGTASAEIYDPSTQTWSPTTDSSSLIQQEGFSTQTLLQDGTTLTTGGVYTIVQPQDGSPPWLWTSNSSELFTYKP